MITDMLSNKKLNPVVTRLYIRDRKLTISLVFLNSLICCAKNIKTKFY